MLHFLCIEHIWNAAKHKKCTEMYMSLTVINEKKIGEKTHMNATKNLHAKCMRNTEIVVRTDSKSTRNTLCSGECKLKNFTKIGKQAIHQKQMCH